MSIKKCFSSNKNTALKRAFNAKVTAGLSEEQAALETIQEFGNQLGERLGALSGQTIDNPILVNTTKLQETRTVIETEEVEIPAKLLSSTEKIRRVPVSKNNIKAKRNRVFQLFEMALQSRELYNSMMTSIDNATTENIVGAMLPTIEENDLHVYTPKAAIETRFNLKAGQSGIGDMVNANNDHTRSQSRGIRMEVDLGSWGNEYMDEGKSELLDPTWKNENIQLILDDINEHIINNTKPGKQISRLLLSDINSRKITEVLSELTNAFVDIANKDSFITRANWGSLMNSYGTMMLRLGVHPIKVFSMIRNPGVTKMLDAIASKEGIIINESTENIRKNIFNEIADEYAEKFGKSYYEERGGLESLDVSHMYFQAKEQSFDTEQDYITALTILEHINDNLKITKKYNNALISAKVGENGIKKSVGDYIVLTNRLSDAFELEGSMGFYGLENKYFDAQGNNTLLMTFHENTAGLFSSIIKSNPDIFVGINEANIELLNNIVSDSSVNSFIQSPYVANQVMDSITTYFISNFHDLNRDYTQEEINTLNTKFFELKREGNYPILKKIMTEVDESGNFIYKANRVNNLDNIIKNRLVSSWEKLLKDHNDLGEFLIRKAFRQSGFQNKIGSFHELIPTSWFVGNNIKQYAATHSVQLDENFFKQVAVNSVGRDLFPAFSKMKPVKGMDRIFVSEEEVGFFKNKEKLKKFPLYTKDREFVYRLLGKEVIKDIATQKSREAGVYLKLPELPSDVVFYHNNEEKFDAALGIDSINDYIMEFTELVKTKHNNKKASAFFIPLEKIYGYYKDDRISRKDVMDMRETVRRRYTDKADTESIKSC